MTSVAVKAKAERLVRECRVTIRQTEAHPGRTHIIAVVLGDTETWRVETEGGTEHCTCPANDLGHKTCSHIEAVWLELRYGKLWRALDRAAVRQARHDATHQEETA